MGELNEYVSDLRKMDWEDIYEKENESLAMIAPQWNILKNVDQYRYKWCLNQINKYYPSKDISILIVGSSTGVLEHFLKRDGYNKITSVDIDDMTLERMKSRVSDVNYVKAYIESLPFNESTYDVSLATEVLEHLVSPIVGLKEMCRVTKDNGSILITVPIGNKIPTKLHRHIFDLYSVVHLFHQIGDDFKVVEIHKLDKKKIHTDPNVFAVRFTKRSK